MCVLCALASMLLLEKFMKFSETHFAFNTFCCCFVVFVAVAYFVLFSKTGSTALLLPNKILFRARMNKIHCYITRKVWWMFDSVFLDSFVHVCQAVLLLVVKTISTDCECEKNLLMHTTLSFPFTSGPRIAIPAFQQHAFCWRINANL